MLTIVILAILALAAVGLVLFVALCLAIQREDHSARLASRPSTGATAVTRRVSGLCVRRAEPPTPGDRPEPYPALWPAPWPRGSDHEGR
jgi:hypothetical protein